MSKNLDADDGPDQCPKYQQGKELKTSSFPSKMAIGVKYGIL